MLLKTYRLIIEKESGVFFACTIFRGIFRSVDGGDHWVCIGNYNFLHYLLIDSKRHLFAVTQHSEIYRSADDGDSWQNIIVGSEINSIKSCVINSEDYFFVITEGGKIYRSVERISSF